MPQERLRRSTVAEERRESEPEVEALKTDQEQKDHSEVDALLDEIDAVLEDNAEFFVKTFVQRGGE